MRYFPLTILWKLIRMDAGRIDYDLRLQGTVFRKQTVAAVYFFNLLYFCVKPEFHSVFTGIFRIRDIQQEGADHPRGRRPQGRCHFICQVWLHGMGFFPVQDL